MSGSLDWARKMLPLAIWRLGITPQEATFLMYILAWHDPGPPRIDYREIAGALGVGTRTLYRWKKSLVDKGLIRVVSQYVIAEDWDRYDMGYPVGNKWDLSPLLVLLWQAYREETEYAKKLERFYERYHERLKDAPPELLREPIVSDGEAEYWPVGEIAPFYKTDPDTWDAQGIVPGPRRY